MHEKNLQPNFQKRGIFFKKSSILQLFCNLLILNFVLLGLNFNLFNTINIERNVLSCKNIFRVKFNGDILM